MQALEEKIALEGWVRGSVAEQSETCTRLKSFQVCHPSRIYFILSAGVTVSEPSNGPVTANSLQGVAICSCTAFLCSIRLESS